MVYTYYFFHIELVLFLGKQLAIKHTHTTISEGGTVFCK